MRGARCVSMAGIILMGFSSSLVHSEEPPAPAPSPRAVEAMRLLDSPDPYQRELGFLRLEALRGPATVATIKKYVASNDPETRAYSLRAVAAIESVQAIPLLLETLKTEKHPRVRRAALLGLEPLQANDPALLPAFIKALRDRSPEVRITAVDLVSRIDEPRAREAILTRNRRERDDDVRRALGLAMRRLEGRGHAQSSSRKAGR